LTVSQHAFTPVSPGTCGSYCHSSLPLAASIACTLLHALVEYSTPSMISGVASWPRCVSRSTNHASPSCLTLPASIFASGEKRCSEYVRPCVSQLAGSWSACTMRVASTCAALTGAVAAASFFWHAEQASAINSVGTRVLVSTGSPN
jgi:hypothetical protein